MPQEFTDIKIVGLDPSYTTTDPARSQTHDFHFSLSSSAPAGWVELANGYFVNPYGTAGRKVRASSRHIIATCSVSDAQQVIDAVKPTLEMVNQQYREWFNTEERKRIQLEADSRNEAERVKNLANNLKFS